MPKPARSTRTDAPFACLISLRQNVKLDHPFDLREICERYGEDVIGSTLASGHTPRRKSFRLIYATDETVEHARIWLTERTRSRQRRERITSSLEIVVVLLIGWEIYLIHQQERLQSRNFNAQQQVLTNLQTSSAETAKTIESMNATLQMQLDALKKSEAQAERSAKAGEANASVAALSLHISERAYLDVDAGLTSAPKVGERLGFQAIFTNLGRTTALDVVARVRSGLDPVSAEHVHRIAFGLPIAYTSKGTISAGDRVQTTWQSAAPLSQAELDGLTTQRTRRYVFADVTYKDEFNQPHQTKFCAFLDPTTNTLLRRGSLNEAK